MNWERKKNQVSGNGLWKTTTTNKKNKKSGNGFVTREKVRAEVCVASDDDDAIDAGSELAQLPDRVIEVTEKLETGAARLCCPNFLSSCVQCATFSWPWSAGHVTRARVASPDMSTRRMSASYIGTWKLFLQNSFTTAALTFTDFPHLQHFSQIFDRFLTIFCRFWPIFSSKSCTIITWLFLIFRSFVADFCRFWPFFWQFFSLLTW